MPRVIQVHITGGWHPEAVNVGDRDRWFHTSWTATVNDDALPVTITCFLAIDEGQPRCVGISLAVPEGGGSLGVDVDPPTPAQIKRAVREAIAAGATPVPPGPSGGVPMFPWPETPGERMRDISAALQRRPYRRITDDHLADVARLYREALRVGVAPRPYIAERLHAADSTVATWIAKARVKEKLGPALGPVAGEVSSPTKKTDRRKKQ